MRYPHSFITTLLCLALLLFTSADSLRPSRTVPADLAPRGEGLTVAQRLARGLPVNLSPREEGSHGAESHINSRGTGRYTAHVVKRSAAPGDPEVFNIALQKTSTSGTTTKRDGNGIGWATVVEGKLSYTDSVELAAKFVWAAFLEGELRALKWIPDDPQGVYQEGVEYAMYALQNSGVWSTGFGSIPADAASKFFDEVMDSVFSPTLTVDSDTTASPSSFIWIVDSSGQIHFAPDVSTAIAMYPGCSVAIAQTIVPGDPATVQAALGWQSSALTSAGKLYVMGNDGSGRWLGVGDDNVFGLTTEDSSTTFYFPFLGSAGPQKVLFQQYEQTSTVILADETTNSAHLAGMSGTTNPALFDIPATGKGVIGLDAGSITWGFYTDSSAADTFNLCTSPTSCGTTFQPACVELVPAGLSPSACAAVVPVTRGSDKWLYATYVIGAKKGWIGVNPQSQSLEWAVEGESTTTPAVFVVPDPADDTSQALGIKINGVAEDVRLLQDSRGYPDSLALSSFVPDEYAAPNVNVLSSSHVTVDTDGFIKTAAGDWFRTFDFLYPLVICNQGNQYCDYAYEPICIEAVEVGGTPSKCLARMKDSVAKNGRKIYASTEDGSMQGWLKLDGELFKPLATRDTASTFYVPGLGNGTAAQELYTSVNGGYNQWWGPYIRPNNDYDYNWLGYGRFGVNPGTNGNQYNVAFDVGASGLGVLAADPDFYYQTFAGMSFYYNPADTLLYLSASEANAKSIGAGLVKVCLEMVDENDTSPPSACAAAQPVKRQLWAEYVDGSGGGWVGYDSDVGGLKWSIPSSPTETKMFYVPTTTASSASSELIIDTGSDASPNKQLVGRTADFEGRQQLGVISTSSPATTVFDIPPGSVGIVSPAAGSSFFTAPWYEPLYICPEAGCGAGGPFQELCLELVPVGQEPSACAAQAQAMVQRNPTRLYAASSDGKTSAYVRTGTDGLLVIDASTITATTFYVPGLNNGTRAQDTYSALGSSWGKIWGSGSFDGSWNFKGFVNLRSGYQESAPFEMPVLYPTTSEFGIVSADNSFYTEGWIVTGPLTYYIKYDDLTLHAFASPELAKASLGTNIAAVCLESVAEDEEPAQCAASFPKLSGPSYLYATGDGGADAGYVSVNANTGKITWARTQSTTIAATFYASQLGSGKPQELLVKVGNTTRPLYAPAGFAPQISGSSDTTAHPASLFTIPTSGAGVVSAPSGLGFYTSTLGFPIYGCSDNKCGTSTPYPSICVELVPAGSTPSACLAQALAATAKNPMVLYARTSDGRVDGYLKSGSSGLTPYATAAEATTFYAPTYGNGSAQHDTYALGSGAYQKIWTTLYKPDTVQRIVSTQKLSLGRSAGPAMIPLIYPSSSVYGAVSPYHGFFGSRALFFYVNTDATDHGLYAAASDDDAAYIGSGTGIVRLCVESLPVGGTPRICTTGARKRGPQRLDGVA